MTIHFHDLEHTGQLQPASHHGETLHLIRAKGRAVQLEVPVGWYSLWMPLAGGLRVKSQDTVWNLGPRDLLIWHEGGLHNCGGQPSWFLALCGPLDAWFPYLPATTDLLHGSRTILPTHTRCPREVRRLFVHLARLLGRAETAIGSVEHLAAACCSAIAENQSEMRKYLARCGGRTAERRHYMLLRLLRVHHLIDNSSDGRFDLMRLSRIASFSHGI